MNNGPVELRLAGISTYRITHSACEIFHTFELKAANGTFSGREPRSYS